MKATINLAIVLAATGCASMEVDEPDLEVSSESSAITGVCAQARTPVGAVHIFGELAAGRSASGGIYAAWTGTAFMPASIVKLDDQLRLVNRWTLGFAGPNINGVFDLGSEVMAAYADNSTAIVDMYKFTSDLSIANYFQTYAGNAATRPFLTNPAGTERAYLWSWQKTLIASAMDSTGYASNGSFFDRTGTITELSGDNGSHDSAVVWVEDLGFGVSRCSAGNIGFDVPNLPSLRKTRIVSTDCRHARIATGPTDDIQAVVAATAGGVVKAYLRRGDADVVRVLSNTGRAPKVRFDGTRFWIVWRETGVGLRIATLDPTGNVVYYPTALPAVASDEAFDLVRASTTTTVLVALTANNLETVSLCR